MTTVVEISVSGFAFIPPIQHFGEAVLAVAADTGW